jgi:hypothetical protein
MIVQSLCQSLFAAELMAPGDAVWIAVRRIYNVALLDNSAHAFRHLEPNWPQGRVRMLSVLEKLIGDGVSIRILTEAHQSNQVFANEFGGLSHGNEPSSLRMLEDWGGLAGGIAGSSFYLEGGLQCSRASGLTVAERELLLFIDGDAIGRGQQRLAEVWEKG